MVGKLQLQRFVELSALMLSVCLLGGASRAHAYVLKTTKTGHGVHWAAPVVSMSVDQKLMDHFGKDEVHDALNIATEAWRGLPHVPDVVISDRSAPGYQAEARTNGVYLMLPWPFAREQLAVTVSTYDLDGHMIGADILINGESDYAFLADQNDVVGMAHHDLAAVLTHEIGHVLGLDESPDDQSATMWPYIRGGEVHQRTISADDEEGVVAAYKDVVFDTDTSVGCTQASVLGARPDASNANLAMWFAGMLFLVQRLAQRRSARVQRPRRPRTAVVSPKFATPTTPTAIQPERSLDEVFVPLFVQSRTVRHSDAPSTCR